MGGALPGATTVVGYVPGTAKAHAVETKPKGKSKGKGSGTLGEQGTQKAASAPSPPLKTEGPAPLKTGAPVSTPKQENPAKQKSTPGKGSSSQDRPILSKKGQQRVRFYRGICNRGQQCDYGHILDLDGPLPIASERRRRRPLLRSRC